MSLFKTLSGVFSRGQKTKKKSDKPRSERKKVETAVRVIVDKKAVEEAEAKAQQILLDARNKALETRSKAEQYARQVQSDFSKRQSEISRQEAEISKKQSVADNQKSQLQTLEQKLETERNELEKKRDMYKRKFNQLAKLSQDEAREIIFETVESRVSNEIEQTIAAAEAKAKSEAQERAKEILIDALKHGATDYVAEYTVSTVKLPNEESKGRIIGKEGRNIRAFEKITGVDIDLDETPGEVRLSSFDPIRREVARVTLSRLLADGRIQPTRIEEYVEKAKSELEKVSFEEGKKLCHSVGVYNLPKELMIKLGEFKYHFAEGQNLLSRTLEQVKIAVSLAEEVGANVDVVRLGALLVDVGRVVQEGEGSHIDLGINLLKRHNIPKDVIDVVAQHHNEHEFISAEAVLVHIAESITMTRPGANFKNFTEHVKRMEKLESIAKDYDAVKEAFVLQAGRDIRVLIDPTKVDDSGMKKLSFDIKEAMRKEMTYPGTISITLMRETRAQAVAK